MNCEQANEYLMKYFDKNTNDIEDAQFRQHLKVCNRCSKEFKNMDELFTFLAEDGLVEPPLDFEAKVMNKVKVLEDERREKTAKSLVLLYNLTTLVSIVLLTIFVAEYRDIDILKVLGQMGEGFNSFSSLVGTLFSILKGFSEFVTNIFTMVFQVSFAFIKTYYYIFAALLAVLLAIQKIFFIFAEQDRR